MRTIFVAMLVGCAPASSPAAMDAAVDGPVDAGSGYTLAFADEFDDLSHGGAPNPAVWDYDVDYNRNSETQCYTLDRRDNVRLEQRTIDGVEVSVLVLEARRESYPCSYANNATFEYTSGSIMTRTRGWGPVKVDMSFGRYEIRAKLPRPERGTWPAIWLAGESSLGSWPSSGEIDIMEQIGAEQVTQDLRRVYSTLHKSTMHPWPTEDFVRTGMGHYLDLAHPVDDGFHVFELDWTPNELTFSVDGNIVGHRVIEYGQPPVWHDSFDRAAIPDTETALGWPYARETAGHQFFMLLNLAFGGPADSWVGAPDPTAFDRGPVEFLVDYVRVYKKDG